MWASARDASGVPTRRSGEEPDATAPSPIAGFRGNGHVQDHAGARTRSKYFLEADMYCGNHLQMSSQV